MSDSKDPLAFDFGIGFKSAAERVVGEREERAALTARELPFHHAFLDDILRSILPHDLILLGAETGAGKTELARIIASASAEAGKRVHYFALEAEHGEIERRDKFAVLSDLLWKHNVHGRSSLNYPDWYRGRCTFANRYEDEAESIVKTKRSTLFTYYRGSKFGHDDIKRLFLSVQSETDLIIVDHLHYVDIEDEDENRGFKKVIKMIRDVALGMGRPVILIAHLRKGDSRAKRIVPHIEDFHGSSDIIKIVTHAIMLAPAKSVPSTDKSIANTFVYVPKDRHGGSTGLIALCGYDRSRKQYLNSYTLGRAKGDQFEQLGPDEVVPEWAKRHVRTAAPVVNMAPVWGYQPGAD